MKTKRLVKNYCVEVLNHNDLTMETVDNYTESIYNEFEIADNEVKAVNRIAVKCYFKELKRQIKNMYV